MNRCLLWIILSWSLVLGASAQSLPDSPRKSNVTQVYKVGHESLRRYFLKDNPFSDRDLGAFVTSFVSGTEQPSLKRGNYMIVKAIGGELKMNDLLVDDLFFKVVRSDRFMICLHDSLGRIIADAEVKCGSKRLPFDPITQTYQAKRIKNESVLEINHQGVYHYLEVSETNGRYGMAYRRHVNGAKSFWKRLVSWFRPSERLEEDPNSGFVVFGKPKYRPNETVRLKGYVTSKRDKPYKGAVDVRLKSYYPNRLDTVLVAGLKPYRPGMFTYEFKLDEGLSLGLDGNYTVELQPVLSPDPIVSGSFRYEEYELQNVEFAMALNKYQYTSTDSVVAHFTARDANNKPVYGGQAELLISLAHWRPDVWNQSVFVPDTIWKKTVSMAEVADKSVTFPDSVFIKGFNGEYVLRVNYLTADRERLAKSATFSVDKRERMIDFSLKDGQLLIRQLYHGVSEATTAKVVLLGVDDQPLKTESVHLPYTMALPWWGRVIKVITSQTKGRTSFEDKMYHDLIDYAFYRVKDSVRLKVNNPSAIPFWYEIRCGKKIIASGRTSDQLDYKVKDERKEGYSMQLSYLFGWQNLRHVESLPYVVNNLSVDVQTPQTVFPGQKSEVTIQVTDRKGRPVDGADVTAYAYTSKFDLDQIPNLPFYGVRREAKPFQNPGYDSDELNIGVTHRLDMNRWRQPLHLDTIAYYRFLYPEVYYSYVEPTTDGTTELLPYVVKDGMLQGVSMLWIDDRLCYTELTASQTVYGFRLEPGQHRLVMRTHDRVVIVNNFEVQKGVRTILSFNATEGYQKLLTDNHGKTWSVTSKVVDKKNRGMFSDEEIKSLSSQLVTIDPTFGELLMPDQSTAMMLPGMVMAGGETFYLNSNLSYHRNRVLGTRVGSPILAGPFPKRYSNGGKDPFMNVYADGRLWSSPAIIGGYHYTLYPGFQKLTPWEKQPFDRRFSVQTPMPDFRPVYLTPNRVERLYINKLFNQWSTLWGRADKRDPKTDDQKGAQLTLSLSRELEEGEMKVKLIYVTSLEQNPAFLPRWYYGNTRRFRDLPAGKTQLNFVLSDSIVYSREVNLQDYGSTFLTLSLEGLTENNKMAASILKDFYQGFRRIALENPYLNKGSEKDSVVDARIDLNAYHIWLKDQPRVITGRVCDESGKPIVGATVLVLNSHVGAITDLNGEFSLKVNKGNRIQISFIGYQTEVIDIGRSEKYKVTLKEDSNLLSETVVVAYGTATKALTGSVEELSIVDDESSSDEKSPLIVVDGVIYDGTLASIKTADMISVETIKDASAVSIYGSRAVNGVIIIKTKNGSLSAPKIEDVDGMEDAGSQPIRHHFSDEAFWQPRLTTDQHGKARFEVTYPDDITSWKAYFIAIGEKKQAAATALTVRSFKPMAAQLSMPRFALLGDSLNAVGRLVNYGKDSMTLVREIVGPEKNDRRSLTIASSHVDYIPVKAEQGDSLSLNYTLKTTDGYFDGEKRTIPIFNTGLLQTSGDFKVLTAPGDYQLTVDRELGEVTLHAEATSLETIRRELDRVKNYPYDCNEQMASKVKVLLAKKRLSQRLGEDFKEDRQIKSLLNKLCKNQNQEGLWGWWNNQSSVFWISQQVLSALLDAEEAGYRLKIDKELVSATLQRQVDQALNDLHLVGHRPLPLAKRELLEHLMTLKRLNATIDYADYFRSIDGALKSRTSADKLKTMETLLTLGQKERINRDSLMACAQQTLLGSVFFGESFKPMGWRMIVEHPQESVAEQTLVGYRLLKAIGASDQELNRVRNYFFELRRDEGWRNTYEISRIIENLLNDWAVDWNRSTDTSLEAARLTVGGKQISKFPYTAKVSVDEVASLRKEGQLPLFITAYQQQWNAHPSVEKEKGFAVRSAFMEKGKAVEHLKAGQPVQLEVIVEVKDEADYVQIEIPIPAGCSYENKRQTSFGEEVHREYFKEKVVIFTRRLTKGEHRFIVDLLPRFSGAFSVNPVKVELMYFPTFYGNEKVKQLLIDELN